MKKPIDALILAAGFGTRLKPLTDEIPKPLLPIGGIPLLDHHLAQLLDSGRVRRVVVNAHHLAVMVAEHVRRHPQRNIVLSYEPEILGTGGAIAQAAEHLQSDPILVINCDILFRAPIEPLLAVHRENDSLATLALVTEPRWASVVASGQRVMEIRRGRALPGAYTFTGCHMVSRELITRLPHGVFHDIINSYLDAIGERRLAAHICPPDECEFLDVGTPADYLAAHRILSGPKAALFGLTASPNTAAGANPGAIRGYGYIHPQAEVGAGARIEESIVLAAARIAPNIHILRSIVGPYVSVDSDLSDTLITRQGRRPIDRAAGGIIASDRP